MDIHTKGGRLEANIVAASLAVCAVMKQQSESLLSLTASPSL